MQGGRSEQGVYPNWSAKQKTKCLKSNKKLYIFYTPKVRDLELRDRRDI